MLTIKVTYDPSVASAPAGFKTAVSAVVAYFESQFNDPVTVNINVGFGEVNGQSLGSSALGESITNLSSYSYSQIKTALVNDAKSPDDTSAVASLPASNSDPISGNHGYWLATAEAKALGLPGSGATIDGYIGFSSTPNIFDYDKSNGISPGQYDFFGTVGHELTEVMGRQMMDGARFPNSSSPSAYELLDLFHYSAPGVRAFTGGQTGYFSINGGSTNLDNFNTNSSGDYGDWANSAGNDSFLAFSGSGVINAITPADLTVMDVLGWDAGQPDLIATNMALSGATISYTIGNSNAALASAPTSTTGIYLSTDSTITTSDTLVGTKSTSPLAAGASDNESVSLTSLTLPDTLAAGTYYIGAVADYNGNISESDETNNVSGAVAVILGNSSDNNLSGTPGNDTLIGLGGNDHLDGGTGADTMIGGKGNDTYVVDNAGDLVVENSGSAYTPPAGFTVKGTADFNHDGNLDVVLSNGTVSEFQLLDANGAVLSTLPAISWSSKWALVGTLDYDHDGNADLLYQKVGTTTMEVDYLNGTTYTGHYFDGTGIMPDALQPLSGGNEGTDLVQSSIDYTLPSGVENLTLTGANPINGTGNALDNVITGNGANNVLTGGAGNDYLDGAAGADTMVGGKGNDTYVVDNAGDVVTENSGTAYTPPAGFTVKGTADFNHDGNLDVVLSNGTVSEFQLLDASGAVLSTAPAISWGAKWALLGTLDYNNDGNADLLYQKVGTTTLEVDYLNGTTYTGNFHGTGITPDALQPLPGGNEGTDTVLSSIDYTLPSGVENLTLTGTNPINGTGNALDNVITGNGANNMLTGGAGADTFVFNPNFGKDTVTDFLPGTDKIQFDNTIFADAASVIANTADDGFGNAIITVDANNTITLQHVTAASLQQHLSDFHIV